MKASAATVMIASPIPISTCTPSMAGRTICNCEVPLNHNCMEAISAAARTAIHAPTPATAYRTPLLRPAAARYSPYPMTAVSSPMLKILAPITSRPPSWKSSPCTAMTAVITKTAAQGPSTMAASAPPKKWPDVPPATGKLSICAAKMKAAITPISGTCFSPSDLFVLEMAIPTVTAVIAQKSREITRLRNPSGI